MNQPLLVDATDLAFWANRRDAQALLPRLVRRLIHATVDHPKRICFRAGEGVQLGGWDGIVEIEQGNAFVPDGLSAWELSVEKKVKAKADSDYEKRCADPFGVDQSNATFVFVTARKWGGKDAWVMERNKEGTWREVRAYDADDMEAWLETAPPVHTWISILLGKHPEGARDVDGYWNACLDNGGGVSALLALARHYSKVPRRQRRRNMIFLVSGDHEVPGTGGPVQFVNKYPEIIDNTAVVFQLEHVASPDITEELAGFARINSERARGLFVTNHSPLLLRFFREATDRYGIVTSLSSYPNYWGDVVGFMQTGITCAGWIEAGYYYHSALDSPALITPQSLERITRAYAYVIDRADSASREEIERGGIATPSLHYDSEMQRFIHSMW